MAGDPHSSVDLMRIGDQLQNSASDQATRALLGELSMAARSLGVPTNQRRDDAPVFIGAPDKLSTATWTQCGGILFALHHDHAPAKNTAHIAARVAERIAALLPDQR